MSSSNRNITVTHDEYAIFGRALPYIAMMIGGALLFITGLLTHIGIKAQEYFGHTDVITSSKAATWIILLSCVLLGAVAWKLFNQRKGQFIAQHATITTVLAHVWLILAVWDNAGGWFFGIPSLYAYFFGAGIVGLSWCIRRWAFRAEEHSEYRGDNPFEEAGLGEARIDGYNSRRIPNGKRFRLKLPVGKTIENAKDKRSAIAHIAGKPRSLVHISETDDEIEGQVDITILDADPFTTHTRWAGPEYAGESIIKPITYATYDNATRPNLHLAGKDGGSCQHFLTMGMPGSGKSKAWQAIYGSVLARREVSVIYGDPAKGLQTGGALASGLEWFAFTKEDCLEQIAAIQRAIVARTHHLTLQGLSHWQPGCGINFIIFHLEEAARFAEVDDLIELIEAARSAGISIVLSLQRATHDRMKVSARNNLGGSMCFGVKSKRDVELGLSEYTRQSGASPHVWQDRKPGHHYLEAIGIDPRMFAHELETDWIDEKELEATVDSCAVYRDPLDQVTAEAFGLQYQAYRQKVANGTTEWQQLRRNRLSAGSTSDTVEMPVADDVVYGEIWQDELPFNVEPIDQAVTEEIPVVADQEPVKRTNLNVSPEEKAAAEDELWRIINDLRANGQTTFSNRDIKRSGFNLRGDSWISKTLNRYALEGKLVKENGLFSTVV